MHTAARPLPLWQTAVIALVTAVIGGVVGALLTNSATHRAATSEAGSSHDQDVVLCTTYALVSATVRGDQPTSVLAAIPPLRLGLTENPDADPGIRSAVLGAIEAYDAMLAKTATPQGLSEPPPYDAAAIAASLDKPRQACGLSR